MEKILSLQNVSKQYSPKSQKVLDEISFDVFEGEIVGLLGCNGSGKTTLIKSILNLLEIDGGEILYLGQNIKHLKRSLFFTEVNAVLEGERNLYWNMTVKENLLYFGRLKNIPGKKIIEQGNEYLRVLGLLENLKTEAGDLSRGMKQKLALAVALIGSPKLILLDEPTLGIDVFSKQELLKCLQSLVKEKKISILLTTHETDVIDKISDRIILLDNHRICFDGSVFDFKRTFSKKNVVIQVAGNPDENILSSYDCKIQSEGFVLTLPNSDFSLCKGIMKSLEEDGYEIISFAKSYASLESILCDFYVESKK